VKYTEQEVLEARQSMERDHAKEIRCRVAREKRYENLPFLPALIAEAVCAQEYTEQEISAELRNEERAKAIEAKRQTMTAKEIKSFAEEVDEKCKASYVAKSDWFMKIIKAGGNRGRDKLYDAIRHYMVRWIKWNKRDKYVITGLVKIRDVVISFDEKDAEEDFRARYMSMTDKESSILSIELLETFRKKNPKTHTARQMALHAITEELNRKSHFPQVSIQDSH
jgi:hypothetical protein